MKIFVIIPAFNEGSHIEATIKSVLSAGDYHCVVVDDGSYDNTYEHASRLTTTLQHPVNRGMGAALATGTIYALSHGAEYIVHFDADGQHRASEIGVVLQPLLEGTVDIVTGSRYLRNNSVPFSKKMFIHKPAIIVQRVLTGLPLTDIHNGFRAMNRKAATLITITQDRMAHASEIISEIRRNGLRWKEVPVTIEYHEYGQGFMGGLRILGDLIRRRLMR